MFARASPEHKLKLVQALQAEGEIVAMTGDGVNDAPALKRADVGVAMGIKGTEAAKEAAEMVLADDNFASIAAAVEEGRTVYDNLKKAIVYILPTSGGEAGAIMMAILLGMTLPITAVQILWVNMITAVTFSLALAFEPPERDVMQRTPRNPGEALLSGFLVWRIVMVSLLLVTACFGLFLWELGPRHEHRGRAHGRGQHAGGGGDGLSLQQPLRLRLGVVAEGHVREPLRAPRDRDVAAAAVPVQLCRRHAGMVWHRGHRRRHVVAHRPLCDIHLLCGGGGKMAVAQTAWTCLVTLVK